MSETKSKTQESPPFTYCFACKKETECLNPQLKKSKNNRLCLSSNCACGKKKNSFIKKEIIKRFPSEVRKQLKEVNPGERFQGGILPLLPLLGLIFSGIGAASGVAGAVAKSVINKQKADEEKRHHEEQERIMREAATQAREEVAREEAAKSAAQGSGLNTKDSK